MQKTMISVGAAAAVLYPQWVWFSSVTLPPTNIITPAQAWGLLAFSIMWLHIVAGPFRSQLDILYPKYEQWIRFSSLLVLAALVLHPMLMLSGFAELTGGSFFGIIATGTAPIIAAVIAWPLFIAYDVLRPFKKRLKGTRAWFWITLGATLPWFLIFYHSLLLGTHIQSGPLRALWWFFGITAAAAACYSFILQPLAQRRSNR